MVLIRGLLKYSLSSAQWPTLLLHLPFLKHVKVLNNNNNNFDIVNMVYIVFIVIFFIVDLS